uniref:Immunoglobulin heavy variable 10-1 n=1 Tax=Cyprinus carpio TaxID=7962 RepID=A0A8C1JSD1_CYPCA
MNPGESHKLTCTASGFDIAGSWMAGIRQKSGNDLECLAFIRYDSLEIYYSQFSRFTISGDTGLNELYLDISSFQTEDTAVYYCAKTDTVDQFSWSAGMKHTVSTISDPVK